MNWTECPIVESVEGKQGGVPLVKGTRIRADQIVEEFRLGSTVAEIIENYPSLTRKQVEELIAFERSQQPQPLP
jgi:uncharacterized protein (DUF433 family)